tara:strand:- start:426 stop:722 length:297 start_codon:yes stop_codon:yes gene_type:complete
MNKYYEQYLKDHSKPKVKLMHFIGQLVTILYLIWVIYFEHWLLLLLAPFVVYPFAVGGHLLFGAKGNKPSFCKMSFLQAKRCDIKMFIDILRGKHRIW